jgi:hypothetical protein
MIAGSTFGKWRLPQSASEQILEWPASPGIVRDPHRAQKP